MRTGCGPAQGTKANRTASTVRGEPLLEAVELATSPVIVVWGASVQSPCCQGPTVRR